MIIKVIALLAAGATVNVAVAWGLVFFIDIEQRDVVFVPAIESDSTYQFGWGADVQRSLGSASVEFTYYPICGSDFPSCPVPGVPQSVPWGTSRTPLSEIGNDSPFLSWEHAEIPAQEARGWPLLCLYSELRRNSSTGQFHPMAGTVVVGEHLRGFPLRPLWPAFAINTLFYAGVLWVLFCGPFALRRMIRRRRGQCAQCGYPIGQNERCTECGADLTPPPRPDLKAAMP